MRRALLLAISLGLGTLKCGNGSAGSPFPQGSGGASGGMSGSEGGKSGGPNDPTLGDPCIDGGQCDDGIPCTADSCDTTLGRCRHRPDGDVCADDLYCNGIEVCVPGIGCRAGPPVACSDDSTCTIDRCVEETRSCEHVARDADGDGDPVWNCGGTDCDDANPNVNGKKDEICANGIDDDCDGAIDAKDTGGCVTPAHDGCADALEIDHDQTVELSLIAASESVALSCAEPGGTRRDVVVALTVPKGPARDIDVVATSDDPGLALGFRGSCSARATDQACSPAVAGGSAADGNFSRVHLYGVEPGSYPLYVSGLNDSSATLTVSFQDASEPPGNDTCGTAQDLVPGSNVSADISVATRDLTSACADETPELVYRFELTEKSDVVLRATALDDYGTPTLSLRGEHCADASDELDCRRAQPARLFARALEPGVYYVAVGATAPSQVEIGLEVLPPSSPDPSEGCAEPPPLSGGVTMPLDLGGRVNSVASPCLPGGLDATFALDLPEPSDVMVVERLSARDTGAVMITPAGCAPDREFACKSSTTSPVRARAFGVPAGSYAVVAESRVGSPIELTAFTRPARPEAVVVFADGCDDAVTIPETGGRFSGNTSNSSADFDASCDYGGVLPGGASDQLLRLHLSESRRVILDLAGSEYQTILVVRKAVGCPGPELLHACAPGRSAERSFLDLTLDAGDYFVQIDGFASQDGPWNLDVYVGSP